MSASNLTKARKNALMAIRRGAILTDNLSQRSAKWLVKNGYATEKPNWCCFGLTEKGEIECEIVAIEFLANG